jgi:hypothetical protein
MDLNPWLKMVAVSFCLTSINCEASLANTRSHKRKAQALPTQSVCCGESIVVLTQQQVISSSVPISKLNTLIVPGKSVGDINKSTTYQGLVRIFGSQRLTATKVYAPEGQAEFAGTLITLAKNRSLTVAWKDKTKKQILYVTIEDRAWKTAEGIGIGMKISKLRQIIGEFRIGGLYWDYGNSVGDLAPAKQAKFSGLLIKVDADPIAAKQFPKDLAAVTGDIESIPANSPKWKRLKMNISDISVYFIDPSL